MVPNLSKDKWASGRTLGLTGGWRATAGRIGRAPADAVSFDAQGFCPRFVPARAAFRRLG